MKKVYYILISLLIFDISLGMNNVSNVRNENSDIKKVGGFKSTTGTHYDLNDRCILSRSDSDSNRNNLIINSKLPFNGKDSKTVNDSGDYYWNVNSDFNFDNKENILIVFQTSGKFEAQYHVYDNDTTFKNNDKKKVNLEHVFMNSVNVFASNDNISFAWTARGHMGHWMHYEVDKTDDNTITVLNLHGAIDHRDMEHETFHGSDNDLKKAGCTSQDQYQWQRWSDEFGTDEPNPNVPREKSYNSMAATFWTVDQLKDHGRICYWDYYEW